MDPKVLVNEGVYLVQFLDDCGHSPRAAVWVNFDEGGAWKLWIVPDKSMENNKYEFYRILSEQLTCHPENFRCLDIAYVEMKKSAHPAITGLQKIVRLEGINQVEIGQILLDGFFLPNGVILRMNT